LTTLAGRIRDWAHRLRRDTLALWIAARDPETPLAAKIVAMIVAAYAFSPIDLIPDFIPIIGLLDDAILVPLGIALAIRLIPADLMVRFRAEAEAWSRQPSSRVAAVLVILSWAAVLLWLVWEVTRYH
jgi:uncharacterized membrane protein YkvA (DUF1232 family)